MNEDKRKILEDYLQTMMMNDNLYHIEYDEKNEINYIQFKCTLKKSLLNGFGNIVDNYTVASTYKTSSDARKNWNLIVFFSF